MRIILTDAERAEIEQARNTAVAGDPSPIFVSLLRDLLPSLAEPEPDGFGRVSYSPHDILRALLAHAEVEDKPLSEDWSERSLTEAETLQRITTAPDGKWWCETCRDYHNDGEHQG